MNNYSSLTDIMINKLSKFILTARKGIFFFSQALSNSQDPFWESVSENHFRNNTKALSAFFTELAFALIVQKQWWVKLLVSQQKQGRGFPGGAVVENLPANAGDTGSSPGLGRSHMPRSN